MSKALFLLVQDNRVLAVEEYLSAMPWHKLNEKRSWKVAIGTVREVPEIVGVIAEAHPTAVCCTWLVTEGNSALTRMCSPVGSLLGFIIGKLDTMFRGGVCSSLSNLPKPIEVIGLSQ